MVPQQRGGQVAAWCDTWRGQPDRPRRQRKPRASPSAGALHPHTAARASAVYAAAQDDRHSASRHSRMARLPDAEPAAPRRAAHPRRRSRVPATARRRSFGSIPDRPPTSALLRLINKGAPTIEGESKGGDCTRSERHRHGGLTPIHIFVDCITEKTCWCGRPHGIECQMLGR